MAQWIEHWPADRKAPCQAHGWVADQVPGGGRARGNQLMHLSCVDVSLPLLFPPSINKYIKSSNNHTNRLRGHCFLFGGPSVLKCALSTRHPLRPASLQQWGREGCLRPAPPPQALSNFCLPAGRGVEHAPRRIISECDMARSLVI